MDLKDIYKKKQYKCKDINEKLLTVAILLPILSFSYEINFNKSFSKVVNPDLLTTNINISVEKKMKKSVNIEVEKFNNF